MAYNRLHLSEDAESGKQKAALSVSPAGIRLNAHIAQFTASQALLSAADDFISGAGTFTAVDCDFLRYVSACHKLLTELCNGSVAIRLGQCTLLI